MVRRTYIIAEAGVNHNGDLQTALQMVKVASKMGADAIKFQFFDASRLVTRYAGMAPYQQRNTGSSGNDTQLEMLRRLELGAADHALLLGECKRTGIAFLSSAFDTEGIDVLINMGINTLKIPSGEITNLPYLRKAGARAAKIILSTGMSSIEEVGAALNVLLNAGMNKRNIVLLQCNTEYPTPYRDVNLKAMLTMKRKFGVKIGFSDHTPGIIIPVAAVALGAIVIEKHFTLNRNMEGPDHKASLDPGQFRNMVRAIRNVELAMGSGIKKPSPSELPNIQVARKSIVASCPISVGTVLSEQNLSVKRPGTGLSPMQWDEVIGTRAKRDYEKDEMI